MLAGLRVMIFIEPSLNPTPYLPSAVKRTTCAIRGKEGEKERIYRSVANKKTPRHKEFTKASHGETADHADWRRLHYLQLSEFKLEQFRYDH